MNKGTLCFDIGIKNLAWCVTTVTGEQITINGWGNYNLLEERASDDAGVKAPSCASCSAKARFSSAIGLSCARHVPASAPLLKDVSGNLFTKIPGAPQLRAILTEKGVKPMPKTKDAMVAAVQAFASLPVVKVKVPHAAAIDVAQIHDAIRTFVTKELKPFFPQLGEVRLENQPVLKNPVMKTVQMLLYATLRDAFLNSGHPTIPFKLVHAGMKVKGKATGTAGYADRKKGSEDRTEATLAKTMVVRGAEWLAFFKGNKKRSDLADAFCMCLDSMPAVKPA